MRNSLINYLSKYINEEHLSNYEKYKRDGKNFQHIKYLVFDNFFKVEFITKLLRKVTNLDFETDNNGLLYDSSAYTINHMKSNKHILEQLFFTDEWLEFVSTIVDCNLIEKQRQIFKYRYHKENSKGFWIHTDVSAESSKSMVVLGYFNKDWNESDGGKLQLWKAYKLSNKPLDYKWKDYVDQPLTFLDEKSTLSIEVSAPGGLIPVVAHKIVDIEPIYNRVVLINFQSSLAFHSVSPNHERRYSFLQWLY